MNIFIILVSIVYCEIKIFPLGTYFSPPQDRLKISLSNLVLNTATSYKASIENIDSSFDATSETISFLTPKNEGLYIFKLVVENPLNEKDYCNFFLIVRKENLTTFKFKPEGTIKKVFLAGEFNSWNSNQTQLKDLDNDGIYEVNLNLLPGRYQYKFVVEEPSGRKNWLQDKNNPLQSPDGFGGFNSIVEVSQIEHPEIIPHKTQIQDKKLNFQFLYKPVNTSSPSKLILINNGKLQTVDFSYLPPENDIYGKITVAVPEIENLNKFSLIVSDKNDNLTEPYEFYYPPSHNWNDAVIYMIFVDRFFNGDKLNDNPVDDPEVGKLANYLGGDLKGIIQKIEEGYFDMLGVNCLWISPVVDNPDFALTESVPPYRKFTGYHGYWPLDWKKIDEHFGDLDDFKQLVAQAHHKNIKILLDWVSHHTYIGHQIFQTHPEWFGSLNLPDGRQNIRLFDEFPYSTWFETFLPAFDFEKNQDAIETVVDDAIWWIKNTDIDGFRLDAVKHNPYIFWQKLSKRIKQEIEFPKNKDFFMVGESISSRELILSFIAPDKLDSQFDFPLYWAIRDVFAWETRDFIDLDKERKRSQEIYKNAITSPLLGNHDFSRFITYADGDVLQNSNDKEIGWTNPPQVDNETSYKKLKLAFAFLLSLNGSPMIYYGDEIGLPGAGDPDNRRMMIFQDKWNSNQRSCFYFVSKLINIRKEHPALRYGLWKTLFVDDNTYIYLRKYFNDEIIFILNRNKKDIELEIPNFIKADIFKDLMFGKVYRRKENKIFLSLPAYSVIILNPA